MNDGNNLDDVVDFEGCENALACKFKDRTFLRNALTHSSSKTEDLPSNERMEFLGDAILGMEVSLLLYKHYPQMNEGEMTKIKSVVVSRAVLAEACEKMGIKEFVLVGKGVKKGEFPVSLWANIFEALVAALYFDQGIRKARGFIIKHLEPYVKKVVADKHGQNYKSILQHYAQKKFGATPIYTQVNESGPDHLKLFEIQVIIAGTRHETAWGNSKKEAEQGAAEATLFKIREQTENED